MITRAARLLTIERVFVKYALDELFLANSSVSGLRHIFLLSPTRWLNQKSRELPRGTRIRLGLQELGPVFVKLGQILSTRRDLLPDDIGDELALLQDQVAPFSAVQARQEIEQALGEPIDALFAEFDDTPIASASVAQVHGITLHDGSYAIAKVLRPDIVDTINRDVGLMYLLAKLAGRILPDGKRLRPVEVVAEYDRTIHGELDLVAEATNAVVLRNNFKDSEKLYVPEIHWDYTRRNVLVQERISGIPIRNVDAMQGLGMNMKKLAENGVEIFYTQVFQHNFFHADMHPGNIFVSAERLDDPQYIAVDFGIVGSLTDDDQRYIGENLLAFFERDYRRVAQLHIDSGWVPAYTRVSELEAGIRAVCEPIFEKPLAEISFGNVLLQLFHVARRFEMEVQPQLVLLQKTLLNIEGLGRELYPELDLWATGKPFLRRWVMQRNNPAAIARRFIEQAPDIIRAMPDMPMLVHEYLQLQNKQSRLNTAGHADSASGHVPSQRASQRSSYGLSSHGPAHKSLRYSIGGVGLLVFSGLLSAACIISGAASVPWWVILGAVCGLIGIIRGLRG